MFSTLNDDCLLLICEYLKLNDRISLANTTKHLSAIIQALYRHGSLELTANCWHYYKEHEEKFYNFWKIISCHLHKLVLQMSEEDQINLLSRCKFSNLKYFNSTFCRRRNTPLIFQLRTFMAANCMKLQNLKLANIYWEEFCKLQYLEFPLLTHLELEVETHYIKQDDFITEMFPKLTTLILKNVALKRGFWNFKNVNSLVLIDCKFLLPVYLERILVNFPLKILKLMLTMEGFVDNSSCCNNETKQFYATALSKCQSLEELTLDYHYFCMFEQELANLKNLRKLHFALTANCACFCSARPMSAALIKCLDKRLNSLTIKCSDLERYWPELQAFFCNSSVKCQLLYKYSPKNLKALAKTDISTYLKDIQLYGILERNNIHAFEYKALLNTLKKGSMQGTLNFLNVTFNDNFDNWNSDDDDGDSGELSLFCFDDNACTSSAQQNLPWVFDYNQSSNEIIRLQDFKLDSSFGEILHTELDFVLEM